jgi:hypothetical protein
MEEVQEPQQDRSQLTVSTLSIVDTDLGFCKTAEKRADDLLKLAGEQIADLKGVGKKPRYKAVEHVRPKTRKEVVVIPPTEEKKQVVDFSLIDKPELPPVVMNFQQQDLPPFIKQREQPKIPTVEKLRQARIQHRLEPDLEAIKQQQEEERKELIVMGLTALATFAFIWFGGKAIKWMWAFTSHDAEPLVSSPLPAQAVEDSKKTQALLPTKATAPPLKKVKKEKLLQQLQPINFEQND